MNYTKDYIQKGSQRRSGQKLKKVVFIVAHDTGNDSSTARGNVSYYKNSCNQMSASAHLFVDDLGVIECIPLDEKAWHVLYEKPKDNRLFGIDANDGAIGVELCYFSKDKKRSLKAYENYVKLIANLCKKYNLNPHKHVVGHSLLDPGRKTDPENALKKINKTFNDLLNDIDKEMKPKAATNKEKCTVKVKFSKASYKLASYRDFLNKHSLKYKEEVGQTITTILVNFAPNSTRYGNLIQYLKDNDITYSLAK